MKSPPPAVSRAFYTLKGIDMAKRKSFKRVVAIADLHCGHRSGLTPPAWQWARDTGYRATDKFGILQHEMWQWYVSALTPLRPIDLLIVVGDAVDGKGSRSGGTELITSDRNVQVDMAAKCIKLARADRYAMVRGTGYHVGQDDDWEDQIKACVRVGGSPDMGTGTSMGDMIVATAA